MKRCAGWIMVLLVTLSIGCSKTSEDSSSSGNASTVPPDTTHVTFQMFAPEDGIATTHSGDKPLPLYPPGIGALSDAKINQGFILLTKLRDENGEVIGFTSEQEVVSSESDLTTGQLKTQSSWTLTIPGRGTIFLYENEDQSEFLAKAGIPALTQKKEWNEKWTFVTTVGPHSSGQGLVVGGTGEFEGIMGTFREVTHLSRFTPKGELFGTIALELAYTKPGGTSTDIAR